MLHGVVSQKISLRRPAPFNLSTTPNFRDLPLAAPYRAPPLDVVCVCETDLLDLVCVFVCVGVSMCVRLSVGVSVWVCVCVWVRNCVCV